MLAGKSLKTVGKSDLSGSHRMRNLTLLVILLVPSLGHSAEKRPNILWIVGENFVGSDVIGKVVVGLYVGVNVTGLNVGSDVGMDVVGLFVGAWLDTVDVGIKEVVGEYVVG